MYDQYDNVINTPTKDNITIQLTANSEDYGIDIENQNNGSFTATLNFTKTGPYNLLNNMFVYIDNFDTATPSALTLSNFPSSITVTSGPCSIANPGVQSINPSIQVGQVISFTIQCYDEFGNQVTTGGANFQATVTGSNLDTVGTDNVPLTITDDENGE